MEPVSDTQPYSSRYKPQASSNIVSQQTCVSERHRGRHCRRPALRRQPRRRRRKPQHCLLLGAHPRRLPPARLRAAGAGRLQLRPIQAKERPRRRAAVPDVRAQVQAKTLPAPAKSGNRCRSAARATKSSWVEKPAYRVYGARKAGRRPVPPL